MSPGSRKPPGQVEINLQVIATDDYIEAQNRGERIAGMVHEPESPALLYEAIMLWVGRKVRKAIGEAVGK